MELLIEKLNKYFFLIIIKTKIIFYRYFDFAVLQYCIQTLI